MVERGEARLDEPLSALLPEPSPRWPGREPTLLELATHRSGLATVPRRIALRELAFALGLRRGDPWAGETEESFDRSISAVALRRLPGVKFRYSNLGYGRALAERAGSDYETLLRDRVCGPLGLTATAVTPPVEHRDLLATGHSRRGAPRPPLRDWIPAAGSLRSNADDMLRLLAACLDPPRAPPGPALALAARAHARVSRRLSVGLGWMIVDAPGKPALCLHNGGTWGFRGFAAFAPESGVAVVVLANTFRSVDRLGLRLVEAARSGSG
jgi:D-alanyl-D-alanine-carboxypeptidase/D-alanyl-D-alanine-endopeptidase